MNNTFTRFLFFTLITCLASAAAFGQNITIQNFETGTYGPGSSITARINVTGNCITNFNNEYRLYLSDASGSFASKRLIGTFDGFYTTFVNGIIPNNAGAGTQYKVRVESTQPALVSNESPAFTIGAANGVEISINSLRLKNNQEEVFGDCNSSGPRNYTFTNSTTNAAVTATITNQLNGNTQNLSFNTSFSADAAHYTISTRAVTGAGVLSTRSYLLVNNTSNLSAFQLSNIPPACIAAGGIITIGIDISNGTGSLTNSYPGSIYTVTWGDGLSNDYTYCQVIDLATNQGGISHAYASSSCGNNIPNEDGTTRFYNSFLLEVKARSLFCSQTGNPLSTGIKVLSAAATNFTILGMGANEELITCEGEVTFDNLSEPGDNPSTSQPSCKNLDARYSWYVDGQLINSNASAGFQFKYTLTPGVHTVRVVLNGGSTCVTNENDITNYAEKQVKVQAAPKASFNINGNTTAFNQCAPFTFTPTNTSVVDNNYKTVATLWTVSGGTNGTDYTINGSVNDPNTPPEITINKVGTYTIRLRLRASTCEDVFTIPVTVNEIPVAELKPGPVPLCNNKSIGYNNNPSSPAYVRLEGTANPDNNTYFWDVQPADPANVNGTATFVDPQNVKYPRINFTGIGDWIVTVTHRNGCRPNGVSSSHTVSVQDAPEVIASTPDQINCPGQPVPVTATITGQYQSARWISIGGGTFDDATALSTTYNPTQAEIDAGAATLNFNVVTNLPAPCNEIDVPVDIKINKPNPITSPLTATACSGNDFSYTISSVLPNSTYYWEIDPAQTSPFANVSVTSGNTYIINGIIENNNPNGVAIQVAYRITPTNEGCMGSAQTLIVTVTPPNPLVDFTTNATDNRVCGPVPVTFTNISPPENGEYEWNFGDGSAPFIGYNPPPHTFPVSNVGRELTYLVTLRLITDCPITAEKDIEVFVSPANPIPVFRATASGTCGPVTITLEDLSPGNNASHTFLLLDENKTVIDQTSTGTSFTVQPNTDGTTRRVYIRMSVTDRCGTTVSSQPQNDQPFSISPTGLVKSMFIDKSPAESCAGQPVDFVNNSTGDFFTYKIYKDGDPTPYQVVNNAPLGRYTHTGFTEAGNYTVTITPGTTGCGPETESTPLGIIIRPVPQLTYTSTLVNCDNLTYKFNIASGIIDAGYAYKWDFKDGTPIDNNSEPEHTFAAEGAYDVTLTITNQLGCGQTITIPLAVQPRLIADFIPLPGEEIFIPNYHFSFRDKTQGNPLSWEWDFGNGATSTQQNPEYTYPVTDVGAHLVTLNVTNLAPDGSVCTSTKQITVTISGTPGTLFVPNAFMPTSSTDALHTFIAKGKGIKEWHMQIFNKWGQLIWETNKLGPDGEPIEGWDGTYKGSPAPQGVYVWQASATFINGTEWKGMSYNNSPPKRTGAVNLIR